MRTRSSVGFVVIGRNEGARLVKCFESIKGIAESVVYVDSGSTDGSPIMAERFGHRIVELDSARPFSAARARNEGFAALKVLNPKIRFVQFIDGDCELIKGWLEEALEFFDKKPDVALVCGRRRERHPEASIYNRLCDLEWNTAVGQALECGGDFLVRVDAFEQVHGFDSGLIASEEPELCVRLREAGWKIWRIDADMTLHDAAISHFGQWWRRVVRSGYGFSQVAKLHPGERKRLLSPIIWGGVIPLLIVIGATVYFPAVWAMLIYPVQLCRIAVRKGPGEPLSWVYALFMLVSKFGDLEGMVRFNWDNWRSRKAQIIEYKH